MSYLGTVQNGVIVLPPDVRLPEGAEVEVTPRELVPEDDPLLATILRLAKPRPHLPADYALNHGHYLRGGPKQ